MSNTIFAKAVRDIVNLTGWAERDVRMFLNAGGFKRTIAAVVGSSPEQFAALHAELSVVVAAKCAATTANRARMAEQSRIGNCRRDARENREASRARLAAGTTEIYVRRSREAP